MFEFELSPEFRGEYENYTFLESLWYRQSEKQCFHLPRVQYGRHLAFYKMAAMKHVLVNISSRYYWESMKIIHFRKANSISNQMNNVSPSPIWSPSCILQNGRYETGFS